MTHRKLSEAVTAYKIGDPDGEYPIFSSEGSVRVEGRWHYKGDRVIYAGINYSTSMLEKLVYLGGMMPSSQHFIEITIPNGVTYEVVTAHSLPDWHKADRRASSEFGHTWYEEQRSCVLFVPSVVARMEQNVVINDQHPDFSKLRAGVEQPIWWDKRLFI